jgi:hypothetical protein
MAGILGLLMSGAGLIKDQYFNLTTLLLPGNGTDGANNNTFLDSGTANSGSGFPITRNGNTTQGTFSPFSQTGWGNYFAGSQSISIAATASLQYSGDFTIEFWFYKLATGDASTFVQQSTNYFALNVNPGTNINIYLNSASANFVITDRVPQANTWHHIALVRSGSGSGNIKCYLDGVASSTTATNTSTLGYNAIGYLGAIGTSATGSYVGYISNFRIASGRAVYTSNFTPPALPLTRTTGGTNPPQGSETIWLTAQSNRFLDSNGVNTPASSPLTITANGSPTVVAFSPFAPTAAYTTAAVGGSGYFDGNTDYLTAASNAAYNFSGDFTIEAWVYLLSFSQNNTIIDTRNGDILGAYVFGVNTNQKLDFLFASSGTTRITSTNNVSLNTWTHVVVSRASGTLRLFINGNQEASTTTSAAINALSFPSIGGGRAGGTDVVNGYYLNGYINGLRVLNGTGYSTITVPTAPLTAISGTSLLLNFTNAGIYDATSKNDLETLDNTVNGVRISTTQFKFGGSSIYFDGTGTDYLWIQADQPIQRFGTAPFTIEMWIRLAALGSARGLVAKGTSTTGWLVSLNTSNQVVFTYGTSTITSTGTISQDAWTYIAVVREGTSTNQTKIYIGGVNDGTGTVSTDFTQTSSMYIGANRTGGDLYSGYIQDVRITNGYARTVTSVPTIAFPTQ